MAELRFDDASEARLERINPRLAERIRTVAEMLEPEGITFRITQGLRSWPEQDGLYAKGRTAMSDIPCHHSTGQSFKPGSCKEHPLGATVTKAKGGESWHNYGMAVDVVPMHNGKPDWDGVEAWQRIITVGGMCALVNGKSWNDQPHFQLTGKFPASPNDEVRMIFHQAGVVAIWDEAGLLDA